MDRNSLGNEMTVLTWLMRLIAWDGLLPAFVWISPVIISTIFPNNRGLIEAAAMFIPIIAFFVRFRVGRHCISSNRCGSAVRVLQYIVFFMGILLLALIDAVMMLSHLNPQDGPFTHPSDRKIWVLLFIAYLTSMIIAMYPGTSRPDAFWSSTEDER
ncbi:MAG: hypothetical protein JWM11_4316 [Planctomycetaceae bacterium]|nr:hypothetical protein [Planctomycetaceae bacterium]